VYHLPDSVGIQELQRAVANAYPRFNVAEYQHEEEIIANDVKNLSRKVISVVSLPFYLI
jgi:hypothetical protein